MNNELLYFKKTKKKKEKKKKLKMKYIKNEK